MFNRRLSQKPTDELYKRFRASFPQLNPGLPTSPGARAVVDALDVASSSRPLDNAQDAKEESAPTPRASGDAWNFNASAAFTPSMMDPDSHTFNLFANQLPGYYTPTPRGTGTLYHNQAGDLHTPTFGVGLGTPLSLPTSEAALQVGDVAFSAFASHLGAHEPQHQFPGLHNYQIHGQPSSFPPHHFTTQPSFSPMQAAIAESPIDDLGMDIGPSNQQAQEPSPQTQMLFDAQPLQDVLPQATPVESGERFRYRTTLNAPTAMVRHADEIPITYLNKGQAYILHVTDTQNLHPAPDMKYRTFVRVSFEDDEQRQKPAACWQLWKEGRGTNEAHQRAGRLQAVEYVEANQAAGVVSEPGKASFQLESASFDGFCVVWSPLASVSECSITVRFNFLSTDFSHSKGVKGIPVRLCAKTELLGEQPGSLPITGPEVCYCKVKLFRDHGAERKLSNDIAHVKKLIEKVNTQIAQLESGQTSGKRKRGNSFASRGAFDIRPSKLPKHSRTWSTSSMTSPVVKSSAEEDLHVKLLGFQDMFTSTRPSSVLNLHGEEGDDPDLHPVKLPGVPQLPERADSGDIAGQEPAQLAHSSLNKSGSASPLSQQMGRKSSDLEALNPATLKRETSSLQPPSLTTAPSADSTNTLASQTPSNPGHKSDSPKIVPLSPTEQQHHAIQVQVDSPSGNTKTNWVEVLGVDKSYNPPPQDPNRPNKPVACFYVQIRVIGRPLSTDAFYRAVYVPQRTAKAFVRATAIKCGIDPNEVLRVVRITRRGLHVLFDDDCIMEMPEAQALTAEFCEYQPETPARRRQDDVSTAATIGAMVGIDAEAGIGNTTTASLPSHAVYELRLMY